MTALSLSKRKKTATYIKIKLAMVDKQSMHCFKHRGIIFD